jgi:anti-sigma factor RsiW
MNSRSTPIGEDDLQMFIDDRLSRQRLALVEAYLSQHSDIRDRVSEDRRHRDILRARFNGIALEPIPMRLRVANIRAGRRRLWLNRLRGASVAASIFLVGAGSGWLANSVRPATSRLISAALTATVAEDAIVAHRTFVVEVAHPVEVDASNEAHLLQWLSKRLGRHLNAPNLSQFGFRLMGGRLLPGSAGDGAAAQLMYDDLSGKRLTLYVHATDGVTTAFRFQQGKDASAFAWIDQGFGFAVTAAGERNALLPIAEAVYRSFDEPDEHTIRAPD